MSEYKSIKGKTVQFLGTDPSDTGAEGQVWYNSTAGAFKSVIVNEAWSSGSNMGTARRSFASAGTQTATLGAGGYTGSNAGLTTTEEYNGSGWSSANNMNISMYANCGVGTQTAASSIGGSNFPGGYPRSAKVQNYDGTTWTTSPTDINSARSTAATGGTQTAAIIAGGFDPSVRVAKTEEYNGTTWSEVNDLNTGRAGLYGVGNQTAMIAASGDTGPSINYSVESYDGTSWTAVATAPPTIDRDYGAAGSTTDALFYVDTSTFGFDGTTFSSKPSMATAKNNIGSAGTQTSAIAFGGSIPPSGTSYLSATEEYNVSINVITPAAWASGGNMGSALRGRIGGGTQSTAIAAGGEVPRTSNTELYDGTSWTEVNNLNTARNQTGGAGTQTSFLVFGGEAPGPTGVTESWDGSSWSEVNDLGTARRNLAGFGTQTAAVGAGGFGPGVSEYTAVVEEWNGSSWTANPNSLPGATAQVDAIGTATAGLVFGGIIPPSGAKLSTTFEFDGTSFSSSGNLNTATAESHMTAGSQTAGLLAGGYAPTASTKTETFDGSVWSTSANMATPRGGGSGLGSNSVSTAGLAAGGNNPGGDLNATEEFTGETSALNIKTLTTS